MDRRTLITVISPKTQHEKPINFSSNLFCDLIWGSPLEMPIRQLLTPQEYRLFVPDEMKIDDDLGLHPRDPREMTEVFTKVYDFLRTNAELFPYLHWLNKYEDPVAAWNSAVTVTGLNGEKWYVNGFHQDIDHQKEVLAYLMRPPRTTLWIPAKPDIVVGSKAIRVRTENYFDHCRLSIEQIFYTCRIAITINQPVAWTTC